MLDIKISGYEFCGDTFRHSPLQLHGRVYVFISILHFYIVYLIQIVHCFSNLKCKICFCILKGNLSIHYFPQQPWLFLCKYCIIYVLVSFCQVLWKTPVKALPVIVRYLLINFGDWTFLPCWLCAMDIIFLVIQATCISLVILLIFLSKVVYCFVIF